MINQLYIRTLCSSWTAIDARWNGYRIYSSFWRLYINKCDGACLILSDKKRYPLKACTIYLIPAWVRFITHTKRRIDHFYVHFDLIGLNTVAMKEIFSLPFELRSAVSFDTLMRQLRLTREAVTADPSAMCRIKSIVYEGLAEMIDSFSDSSKRSLDQRLAIQNRFADVLRYVDEHLGEDLRNVRLARCGHMSVSHFVRSFQSAVGQSPARYVLQRRIARAAQELVLTSAKIEEIAERCGFANRFHFTRNFHRLMGVSPAVYRKATPV